VFLSSSLAFYVKLLLSNGLIGSDFYDSISSENIEAKGLMFTSAFTDVMCRYLPKRTERPNSYTFKVLLVCIKLVI
jgi:hypothetical protein